ncbi:MAG: hypothetical protein IPO89_10150 [Actinomycetales bacterium]|nr:hypothetical protein [Candidatus Lutibacillus vidarii]
MTGPWWTSSCSRWRSRSSTRSTSRWTSKRRSCGPRRRRRSRWRSRRAPRSRRRTPGGGRRRRACLPRGRRGRRAAAAGHHRGATADPVKDYLKQIGKVALLNAEQEVEFRQAHRGGSVRRGAARLGPVHRHEDPP